MDLSSIRSALNGFSNATPVHPAPASAFLLGEEARTLPAQAPLMLDLNQPSAINVEIIDDFTQDDGLEIDYACGSPEPVLALYYNTDMAATEILLDGIIVAMVRMREGHGPLRAAAIRLIPDLSLAAIDQAAE